MPLSNASPRSGRDSPRKTEICFSRLRNRSIEGTRNLQFESGRFSDVEERKALSAAKQALRFLFRSPFPGL